MLISEAYKEQNRLLHEERPDYGANSHRLAGMVKDMCRQGPFASVLDYGCGKGTLKEFLPGLDVREYDPAITGKDGSPEPADLVVCSDVLEHIEPDCLADVLADLRRVSGRMALLVISTIPATKTLPDGRNAHLIVEDPGWWRAKVSEHFTIILKSVQEDCGVLFIAEPKC